jgi:hypothetical protein
VPSAKPRQEKKKRGRRDPAEAIRKIQPKSEKFTSSIAGKRAATNARGPGNEEIHRLANLRRNKKITRGTLKNGERESGHAFARGMNPDQGRGKEIGQRKRRLNQAEPEIRRQNEERRTPLESRESTKKKLGHKQDLKIDFFHRNQQGLHKAPRSLSSLPHLIIGTQSS